MSNKLIISFLSTLICLIIGGTQAQAQVIQEDVVYLHNGSIIRGEITERVIGDHLKIEIVGGSVFVYKESEIEKITREPKKMLRPAPVSYVSPDGTTNPTGPATRSNPYYSPNSRRIARKQRPITGRPKGIYNLFSFGFQPGRDAWNTVVPWPTLNYRTGYSFSPLVNVGLGVGLDPYAAGGTFPIYLDLHGDIGEHKQVMPHYFVQGGYGLNGWTNWRFRNFEGGPMGHLGMGWKVNTRNRTEWMFTLGFKMQAASFQTDPGWDPWGNPIEPGVRGSTVYRALTMQAVFGF